MAVRLNSGMKPRALLLLACLGCNAAAGEPATGPRDANRELERTYQAILAGADDRGKALLDVSQRAWEQYRRLDCDVHPDAGYEKCLDEMAKARTAELHRLAPLYARSTAARQ